MEPQPQVEEPPKRKYAVRRKNAVVSDAVVVDVPAPVQSEESSGSPPSEGESVEKPKKEPKEPKEKAKPRKRVLPAVATQQPVVIDAKFFGELGATLKAMQREAKNNQYSQFVVA